MANQPFDQRIINPLERPTSSDLNIAQSQLNANVRAVMRSLLQTTSYNWGTGVGPSGALGDSFLCRAASPASWTITLTRGIGFASYAAPAYGIGGILGVDNDFDYPVVYTQDRTIDTSGVAAPAAGKCRRDVIAIRPRGTYSSGINGGLTDQQTSDIYDPGLNAFDAQTVYKTLTSDITNSVVTFQTYLDTVVGDIVYRTGPEVTYTGPDSLLSSTLPTAPTPYLNIAVINRYDGQTEITAADIVDYRRVSGANGALTVRGSATIGASSIVSGPGSELSSVVIKAPPGIKAAIYKLGENSAYQTNTYALYVAGVRSISSASVAFTVGKPGGALTSTTTLLPAQVLTDAPTLNNTADDAVVTLLADSAKTSPVQTVAVGQPVHIFPFTIGTVENVVETVLAPVTVTGGTITIPDPPNYPAMYPAGTYDVAGNQDNRTYYLNYNVSPVSPTTGLPSPTYALGTSNTSTPSSVLAVPVPSSATGYSRIWGFVVSPFENNFTIAPGVWKFSLNTRSIEDPAKLRVRLYLYNGSTNPELGTILAETEAVIPSAVTPRYFTFYTRIASSINVGLSRVYLSVEAVCTTATDTHIDAFFGDDDPAVLETTIASATPTVTIPDSTTNYPADTYTMTAATGSAAFNIPTAQPKLDPATLRFREDSGPTVITRTIPVNFTITLDLPA